MVSAKERNALPKETGVYLLYSKDTLLYVGKAKNISQRVEDHFKNKPWANKISEIDFIILPTEEEALITEREIIASRRPRYNIRLRDDKSYPMIAVSIDEEFPRVFLTREKQVPGRLYFGPWTDARRARNILKTLPEIFPFRSCTGGEPGRKTGSPCLDFYIDRCDAPCVGKISAKEYRKGIDKIIAFLSGKREAIVKEEETKMQAAAKRKDFELAAMHRDRVRALKKISSRGGEWGADRNAIAAATEKDSAALSILEIREGKISEHKTFLLENKGGLSPDEVIEGFLILMPEESPLLPWTAKNEKEKKLIQIAKRDARLQLRHDRTRQKGETLNLSEALASLEGIIGVKPLRIEGYDVANLGDKNTVGAMVVFENGLPRPRAYRTFKISTSGKPDDYRSLRETIERRLLAFEKHSALSPFDPQRDESLASFPDLFLIDGGRGQLSAAKKALKKYPEVRVLALAKKKEEIWTSSGKSALSPTSEASMLLQRVRDEAHLLSNTKHQKERSQEMWRSPLRSIPGVGKERERQLLKKFGSLRAIKKAGAKEIAALPGISSELANKITNSLEDS